MIFLIKLLFLKKLYQKMNKIGLKYKNMFKIILIEKLLDSIAS